MTDRDRRGLCGAVRSCETQGTAARIEFRADGGLARDWSRNSDGAEWAANYEYDDAGRLAAMVFEDANGVSGRRIFQYDSEGRVSRVLVCGTDTGEQIAETYSYDEAGRKTKIIHADLSAQHADMNYVWGVEGMDTGWYGAPGAATITTTYDENDRPTALLFHDAAGLPLSRVEFLYDGAGNLIEETQIREEPGLSPKMIARLNPAQRLAFLDLARTQRFHRYNDRSRRIETVFRLGKLSTERQTTTYNEQGGVAEEASEQEGQEYGLDEEGLLWDKPGSKKVDWHANRFSYEYDARGNWTVKTGESRRDNIENFTVFSVERRTLSYY